MKKLLFAMMLVSVMSPKSFASTSPTAASQKVGNLVNFLVAHGAKIAPAVVVMPGLATSTVVVGFSADPDPKKNTLSGSIRVMDYEHPSADPVQTVLLNEDATKELLADLKAIGLPTQTPYIPGPDLSLIDRLTITILSAPGHPEIPDNYETYANINLDYFNH